MSSTYFISDLHLDASRPAVTAALEDFLQNLSHCDALYILGDLFEVWVGDDDDSPLARHIADLLRRFSSTGAPLYLMHGNRDFLLGTDFAAATGASLLCDPTVIELYGVPTLLMHGDSLCSADTHYQAFRERTRQPNWQTEVREQSLEQRRELAAQLRIQSKEANSNKAHDIMDVTPAEVARVMSDHGVRQLIHGHTHRPARHDDNNGLRWVLGDWDSKGWAIKANWKKISLYDFQI